MKLHFGHLVLLAALAIGGCAAFFSVFGISQLFAGAFWAVVIMASTLEFGKLILASHLQRYWMKLGKVRRIYLATLVIFLMIITSAGIYGLLSSAYQKTYTSYSIMENQVSFLEQKKELYQSDIDRYDKDIAQSNDIIRQKNNNISQNSGAKSRSIQYKDKNGQIMTSVSNAELRAAEINIKRETDAIALEETNKRALETKRMVAIDSLNSYKTKILISQSNTDISGELGPLIYLKNLTGLSMDSVVNFFIILLVFVFDPLAIMLILESNRIFEDKRKEKEEKEGIGVSIGSKGHIDEDGRAHIDEVIGADVVEKPLNLELDPNLKRYIDSMLKVQESLKEDMPKAVGIPEKYQGSDNVEYKQYELMERDPENGKFTPIIKEEDEPTSVVEELELPSIPQRPEIIQDERPVAKNGILKPASNMGATREASEPIVPKGTIQREDIKEIKEGASRKFSKPIPRRGGNE